MPLSSADFLSSDPTQRTKFRNIGITPFEGSRMFRACGQSTRGSHDIDKHVTVWFSPSSPPTDSEAPQICMSQSCHEATLTFHRSSQQTIPRRNNSICNRYRTSNTSTVSKTTFAMECLLSDVVLTQLGLPSVDVDVSSSDMRRTSFSELNNPHSSRCQERATWPLHGEH